MYDWQKYNRVGKTLLKRLDLLGPFIHPIKRQFLLARVDRMRKREEIQQERVEYQLEKGIQQ